jgi:hypothetical protein
VIHRLRRFTKDTAANQGRHDEVLLFDVSHLIFEKPTIE